MRNNCRGQSTVEYIVLVSAVIAVAVAFFLNPTVGFQKTMNTTYGKTTSQISTLKTTLTNSHNSPDVPANYDGMTEFTNEAVLCADGVNAEDGTCL